jgi:LmbE family N-acetylglucosaminyl deacetylase
MNGWKGLEAVRHVLCLGAHCDDIEIGCGGLLLNLPSGAQVTAVVFSRDDTRADETRIAMHELAPDTGLDLRLHRFRDGHFPSDWGDIKEAMEALKMIRPPDLILTHYREDGHQDHRIVSDLTWNTFRNHTILEYEIPKFDDDTGSPNAFLPLSEEIAVRKAQIIVTSFASQSGKPWMTPDAFLGLMRLRGIQCQTRYAEAFYSRKMVL